MRRFIIALALFSVCAGFKSKEIDRKKIERDLEIAKDILVTLMKSGSDQFFGRSSIKADYIEGYGVVFTIPEHLVYFHSAHGSMMILPEIPTIPELDIDVDVSPQVEIYLDPDNNEIREEIKEERERVREQIIISERKALKTREKARNSFSEENDVSRFHSGENSFEEIDWKDIMITFMTDYADLIGQLESDERIVIQQKAPNVNFIYVWDDDAGVKKDGESPGSISAEVLRKDVSAFKSGKISKETFVDRIKIEEVKPMKKIPDLEMFASIFNRYYSRDLTETFYSNGKPRYEKLENYGAIFHIKAVSPSYYKVKSRRSENWGEEEEVSAEDEKSRYTQFKEDLKDFVLDYGRTIRSLEKDEKVVLDIDLKSCRSCDLPKGLKVTVDCATLNNYDLQKLTKEKAKSLIEIKESLEEQNN